MNQILSCQKESFLPCEAFIKNGDDRQLIKIRHPASEFDEFDVQTVRTSANFGARVSDLPEPQERNRRGIFCNFLSTDHKLNRAADLAAVRSVLSLREVHQRLSRRIALAPPLRHLLPEQRDLHSDHPDPDLQHQASGDCSDFEQPAVLRERAGEEPEGPGPAAHWTAPAAGSLHSLPADQLGADVQQADGRRHSAGCRQRAPEVRYQEPDDPVHDPADLHQEEVLQLERVAAGADQPQRPNVLSFNFRV